MNIESNLAGDDLMLHDVVQDEVHVDEGSMTTLGFWIYLMSDCILFSGIFATFAVLHNNTAGGPDARDLFSLPYAAVETGCLLLSSLTYGMAMLAMQRNATAQVVRWLGVTLLLGAGFMALEIHEFVDLIAQGAGPDRSAFLSSFFTLVGTHGLHVLCGMVWMSVLIGHLLYRGLTPENRTRLMCLSLFWHFLDIVWIGVFTLVYLSGVAA